MSDPSMISEQAVAEARDAALAAIAGAASIADLKAVKQAHTGEHSPLAQLNALLRSVPNDQKAAAGKLVGGTRAQVSRELAAREEALAAAEATAQLAAEAVDVTTAGIRHRAGARQPISLLMERMQDTFIGMGWEWAEGPELDHEWYVFDALNTDPDHPARGDQDTFYIEPEGSHLALRSHTSTVQVRSLLSRDLPLYVVAPGRVFRKDEFDATHLPVFHQIEGIAVDKGLTMADLKGTLNHFARLMFGDEAKVRLRPNYFPFTEPSAELDLWHPTFKHGARWIEWGGCGMVNPNVLAAAGVDPEEYSGFAFGMGIERALMFRTDVQDMRDMAEGDVRFSQQFGMVI